jgi:lipoprotein-anchoring transpeptidase ErfK/SrfK
MIRFSLPLASAAAILALSVAPATAQHRPGALGGGFIEMLMTGRDPGPAARPTYAEPRSLAMPPRPVRSGALYNIAPEPDPMQGLESQERSQERLQAPGRTRQASLGGAYTMEREIPAAYRRQSVSYDGPHGAGTVVIDTEQKFLYLVEGGGRATRYGIGVGRPGFEWAGVKSITRKAEWPAWTPPPQMLQRRPDLPRHMVGGPDNPLGARAMYLGSSLYRIHGTNEPHTIGQAVSSGCIRMTNEDVTDLYERVRVGTKVVVR